MPVYGFDANSAKRIGETVRLVEGRRVGTRNAYGGEVGRAAVGVRCMLGTIGTAAWSKGSSSTLTLCSGEPGSESSTETMTAYNYVAGIPESTASSRYVVLGNNGFGWVAIESESSASVSISTAQATYVVGVDVSASLNTATCSISISKTVTTAAIIYATTTV